MKEVIGGAYGCSGLHYFTFDNKKAYVIDCSCDAFILAFSKMYEYVEDMKEAIKNKDIERIISIIYSCEDDVKNIKDYQKFLENEIDKHVENSLIDFQDCCNEKCNFEDIVYV